MRRLVLATALAILALVMSTAASAGSVTYYSGSPWSPGSGGSTGFSSSWVVNIMTKNAPFDSAITFIDNTSYGWHSTLHGPGTYLRTQWFSSAVKKAHCRSNVTTSVHAACTAWN